VGHKSGRERAKILKWHDAHGSSVTATCKQFGLSRMTLYRWLARFDATHPVASLNRSRRRSKTRRAAPKQALFLLEVIDLNLEHPTWGRGRYRVELLSRRDDAPSPATIGRWLASIRRRCPICKGRGKHNEVLHVFGRDLTKKMGLAPAGPRLTRRVEPLSKQGAVAAAERMLKSNR
jgi:transposase